MEHVGIARVQLSKILAMAPKPAAANASMTTWNMLGLQGFSSAARVMSVRFNHIALTQPPSAKSNTLMAVRNAGSKQS
eukprot:CAMPEP_0172935652 /NCGR_PEP_ID=MMETSP1075-20121228/221622_1 /TAXON_ID=2916 /ORGANISM="Ceratium fusus, Strain PA161109" /LENGTH=77 /DNA_ID=CAMNT_0013797011 /DNA_START=766 /DNA_END=999 /DNA_ORIENTATION=-